MVRIIELVCSCIILETKKSIKMDPYTDCFVLIFVKLSLGNYLNWRRRRQIFFLFLSLASIFALCMILQFLTKTNIFLHWESNPGSYVNKSLWSGCYDQCDQIELFWKNLTTNFLSKVAQIFLQLFNFFILFKCL